MDQYLLMLTLIGIATFGMAWMPNISKKTGISYSIFYLLAGFILYKLFPAHLPNPLPQKNESLTLHLTELVVIISLMGTGLKIDRPFSFRNWSAPLKLIAITMPLCIAATILLGYYFLGLGLASAALLGAVLAPTDPVLAADVQVGPPNGPSESETRFTLTSEAGLNDGVAFPFTWLAVTLGLMASGKASDLWNWLAFDTLYRIAAGIAIGYIAGKAIGFLVFRRGEKNRFLDTKDGLLGIGITLLVYGLTEIVHGYGFISVFVCAVTFRHYKREHDYHAELHSFTDQVERLIVCILLILFGGIVAMGILSPLTWQMVLFASTFLLLIRPLAGISALSTAALDIKEKLAISFFGIRGMGSVFYLSFGLTKYDFDFQDELWAIVSLTILISVMLHGLSATSVIKRLK